MIPNGKEMDWNGHHLVFESENYQCRGCFFADKDECPDCDQGVWVEKNPYPWHTGTPTETGEYLVCRVPEAGYLFRYNQLCVFSDLMGILEHKIFYIGEVGKNSFENITDSVIAWQKIEPYVEASK